LNIFKKSEGGVGIVILGAMEDVESQQLDAGMPGTVDEVLPSLHCGSAANAFPHIKAQIAPIMMKE